MNSQANQSAAPSTTPAPAGAGKPEGTRRKRRGAAEAEGSVIYMLSEPQTTPGEVPHFTKTFAKAGAAMLAKVANPHLDLYSLQKLDVVEQMEGDQVILTTRPAGKAADKAADTAV